MATEQAGSGGGEHPPEGPGREPGGPAEEGQEPEGQVSEVSSLGAAGRSEPITPHDATAGYPGDEAGAPEEGPAGPDAPAREE